MTSLFQSLCIVNGMLNRIFSIQKYNYKRTNQYYDLPRKRQLLTGVACSRHLLFSVDQHQWLEWVDHFPSWSGGLADAMRRQNCDVTAHGAVT